MRSEHHRRTDRKDRPSALGRSVAALSALTLVYLASPRAASAQTSNQARTIETALVTAFVGLDFGARQLHYRERVTNGTLRPYDLPSAGLLPAAPGFAVAAEVFPFAGTTWGIARDVGVSGHANYNLASSKVGNVTPKTRWFAWEFDLRGRFLLGAARTAPLLGIEVGLGRQAFLFSDAGEITEILPSVDYYYVRLGADGRIPVGPVSVIVGAAYRHLQSRRGSRGEQVPAAGEFGEHFPGADISGLDFKLGGALPIAERFEARLLINYVRYSSDLNAKTDAAYIAKEATDQFLNVDLGVAAFF